MLHSMASLWLPWRVRNFSVRSNENILRSSNLLSKYGPLWLQKAKMAKLYCQTQSIRTVVDKPMVDVRVGFYTRFSLFMVVCCCLSDFFRLLFGLFQIVSTSASNTSNTIVQVVGDTDVKAADALKRCTEARPSPQQ